MKRSYSHMTLSLLPKLSIDDPKHFKSVLDGSYTLEVTKVTDISKPAERPIDEIEEPEEDEVAQQNKLNKSNARMIQLNLKDSENTEIMAIEVEKIDRLTHIKPSTFICIQGPLEVRCRNIMLQNKHITEILNKPKEEVKHESKPETVSTVAKEPTVSLAPTVASTPKVSAQEIILLDEDWDEDDEEDCIILN